MWPSPSSSPSSVAVGLDSPLLGLDIHCRCVSFAVVALDWLRIRLIAVEPSRRRRSHLVIILPVATSTSRLAVGVIVGVNVSSMGRTFRRWAVRFVDGPYVSSMGVMCRCWTLRVVDEWCVLSMGHCNPPILALIPQKRGGYAFLGASIHSLCRRRLEYRGGDSPFRQVWWPWVQRLVGWKERGKRKTNHDKRRGSFSGRTSWASHCMGPLVFLCPPIHFPSPNPSSREKGRGGVAGVARRARRSVGS